LCRSRSQLEQKSRLALFEATVLPHLSAAYNFARWLLRDESDAEDVVQESYLRALRYFESYHGGDSRAWLLSIVRNTTYNWLQQNRSRQLTEPIDETTEALFPTDEQNPETILFARIDYELLRQALAELPIEFREVLVLREMEDLSYKEIAALCDLPIGTVMSRLARGRTRLQQRLAHSESGTVK
jgi:RNA polymerase sigma-70 factor, ECF subfamily